MNKLYMFLFTLFLVVIGSPVMALSISPGTEVDYGGSPMGGPDSTSANTINSYILSTYGVTQDYKSNAPDGGGLGSDEGPFSGSYNTAFNGDNSGGTISHIMGQNSIVCPECYLLVKDGNRAPKWYLFNLGAWDGQEAIMLSGFWPNQGAISHVAIYSKDPGSGGDVAAPAPLLIMAIGLMGMLGVGRFKSVS